MPIGRRGDEKGDGQWGRREKQQRDNRQKRYERKNKGREAWLISAVSRYQSSGNVDCIAWSFLAVFQDEILALNADGHIINNIPLVSITNVSSIQQQGPEPLLVITEPDFNMCKNEPPTNPFIQAFIIFLFLKIHVIHFDRLHHRCFTLGKYREHFLIRCIAINHNTTTSEKHTLMTAVSQVNIY